MQISEILPEMTNISIRARILSIQIPQSVRSKSGKQLRVAEAILGDNSGRIPLTLWQNQIYKVKTNQVVDLKDCYASQYLGITKLTLGRNGTLEVIEDPSFPSIDELMQSLRDENQP
jgi:replication factor A1